MPTDILTLAQSSSSGGAAAGAAGLVILLLYIALIVFIIATFWRIFTKAGQPGWAAIIPFYNYYIWCRIVGRPGWWLILLFVPVVSIVIAIILCIDLAKSFGKGVGFAIGMILLGIVFFPILAWGSAQYQGPSAAS